MNSVLNSVFWVGYSKASGLVRDLMLVALLGMTTNADAVFLGMTIAMFFQLTAYQAGINHLLGNQASLKIAGVLSKYRIAFLLLAGEFLILSFYLIFVYQWSAMWSVTGFFLLLAPLALYIGVGTALCVLAGINSAQAVVISLQNTAILAALTLIFFNTDNKFVVLAWLLALGISALAVPYAMRRSDIFAISSSGGRKSAGEVSASTAFLIPALALLIGLSERWFYLGLEGALSFIKVLDTAATSIAFLCQVLVYNKVLATINNQAVTGRRGGSATYGRVLLGSLFVSIAMGGVIYLSAIFVIKVSWLILAPELQMPVKLRESINILVVVYSLYLVGWILREHVERLVMLSGGGMEIVLASLAVLLLTWILNYSFIGYVPLSVLVISVLLLFIKSGYLMARYMKKAYSS